MLSALDGVEARAEQRVDHETLGYVPRETHVHSGVDHGLHGQEDVGGARARDSRGHVEEALVGHADLIADRAEELGDLGLGLVGKARGAAPDSAALLHRDRGVGHRAHDIVNLRERLEGDERHTGDDGDEHSRLGDPAMRCRLFFESVEHVLNVLGLHCQDHHIRVLACLKKRCRTAHSGKAFCTIPHHVFVDVVDGNVGGLLHAIADDAANDGLRHLSSTNECEFAVCKSAFFRGFSSCGKLVPAQIFASGGRRKLL
mmetsp:Transcript_12952/g.30853  ORF Transcript_12952/g.30853 Transcript_12952/m.30853 type:complete len:258 (-) Transcript_12952:302-1075(-)